MTASTIAPRRKPKPKWVSGDLLTVGRTRYVIRVVYSTGRVLLEAMNTVTAKALWWDTTLENLPEKTA